MRISMVLVITMIILAGCASALNAAEVTFHGDLNHRFQYTDRAYFLTGDSRSDRPQINNGDVDENFGEIKYRLWVEAATNDNNVKGVVATEIGGLRFGESSKADFSGDDIQFEVRWAYTDFQLPGVQNKARAKMGLQPFKVNRYLWQETVAGVAFDSTIGDTVEKA